MPILISYENARGEEIVLDDTERSFLGELYGRQGTEAPKLKFSEILYGDGSTDIVAMAAEPREVTLYFWAPAGTPKFRQRLEDIKQKLVQTGSRTGGWGKLKIRRPDGVMVVLNCAYIAGMDDLVRDAPKAIKFALTFRANDPLFYASHVSRFVVRAVDAKGYLLELPLTFTGDVYDFDEDNIEANPDGLFMAPLDDPINDNYIANPDSIYMLAASNESGSELELDCQKVWPDITVTGPAKNIRIVNKFTGKKIEFDSTVETDGENSILIVTRPLHRKVVKVNGSTGVETNILGKLTADSSLDFFLERGTNLIIFRNDEATPETACTFSYTEGWLSAE